MGFPIFIALILLHYVMGAVLTSIFTGRAGAEDDSIVYVPPYARYIAPSVGFMFTAM